MKISTRRKINSSITIITIGMLAGFLYPVMAKELDDPNKVLNGLIIGFLGSGFLVINEIWLRRMVIRRLKFSNLILIKSLHYTSFLIVLITLVMSLDRARRLQFTLFDYWRSAEFQHLLFKEDFFLIVLYALLVTVIFILFYLISRKMGQGVLWNFVIGRYHKPSTQDRIFMYLDLNDSTTIAEKLGDLKYHKFLNQFFFDITDSIVLNYGRIYRYIGDEVIITWNLKKGIKQASFLKAFVDAKRQVEKKKESYMLAFGIVPEFTAAVHCGEVVIGELGEVKSEIGYIGEVLQETSCIEQACSLYSSELLISKKLFALMSKLPEIQVRQSYTINVNESAPLEVVEIAVAR